MKLKQNEVVALEDGTKLVVESLLGAGGQGEVYLVSMNGAKYALKVYINEVKPEFKKNLKSLIDRGSPAETFLWPKRYFEYEGKVGYLMDLRPQNYVSFTKYVNGDEKAQFKNKFIMVKWCISLCTSFKKLHEKGYSYQDLNDGGFFLDPNTGDLLICDNDNVTADKNNLGIQGIIKFMAPEVVRKEMNPDTHSDRFSLAVVLFMALCKGRPFEGEKLKDYEIMDEQAIFEMYGKNPVFVYHKTDRSNRPIRGYHTALIKKWLSIPIYIKEAFHRTFVDGLTDRENARTTEIEWNKFLCKYRDEVMSCPYCQSDYIYGFEEKQPNKICPYCGKPTKDVCVLHVGRHRIVLDLGKEIFRHHLDKYSDDYCTPVGRVISNKNNPSLWGLRLALPQEVVVRDVTGKEKIFAGNGVILLARNLTIQFNNTTQGEIE